MALTWSLALSSSPLQARVLRPHFEIKQTPACKQKRTVSSIRDMSHLPEKWRDLGNLFSIKKYQLENINTYLMQDLSNEENHERKEFQSFFASNNVKTYHSFIQELKHLREDLDKALEAKDLEPQFKYLFLNTYLQDIYLPFRKATLLYHFQENRSRKPLGDLLDLLPRKTLEISEEDLGKAMIYLNAHEDRSKCEIERAEQVNLIEMFLDDGSKPQGLFGKDLVYQTNLFNLELIEEGKYKVILQSTKSMTQWDLKQIVSVPAPYNYISGLKWLTVQMLVDQILSYRQILKAHDSDGEIFVDLPKSCQLGGGGFYPKRLEAQRVSLEEQISWKENLLAENGFIEGSDLWQEIYMDMVDLAPNAMGFSSLQPLDSYFHAQLGKEAKYHSGVPDRDFMNTVELEDISSFNEVMSVAIPKGLRKIKVKKAIKEIDNIQPVFDPSKNICEMTNRERRYFESIAKQTKPSFPQIPSGQYIDNGGTCYLDKKDLQQTFVQLLSMASGSHRFEKDGNVYSVPLDGVSQYMAEEMITTNSRNWQNIIPANVKMSLARNTISLPFPKYYGSHHWRVWGLTTLYEAVSSHDIKDRARLADFHSELCPSLSGGYSSAGYSKDSLCYYEPMAEIRLSQKNLKRHRHQQYIQRVRDLLDDFKIQDGFIPTSFFYDPLLEKNYLSLKRLWDLLVVKGKLPQTKISEWDFIKARMEDHNPYAALRLTYKLVEAKYEKSQNRCHKEEWRALKSGLKELKLDRPLTQAQGNKTLTPRERRESFKRIERNIDKKNQHLFHLTMANDKMSFYERLHAISQTNLLVEKQRNELYQDGVIPRHMKNDIENFLEIKKDDSGFEILMELAELTKNKAANSEARLSRQMTLAEEFYEKIGYESEEDLKASLLGLESRTKKIAYHQLLNNTLVKRVGMLSQGLHSLCELNPDIENKTFDLPLLGYSGEGIEDFKQLFYMTLENHEKLAQVTGREMPPQLRKLANAMTMAERKALQKGGLSMLMFVGSLALFALAPVTGGATLIPAIAMTGLYVGTQVAAYNHEVNAPGEHLIYQDNLKRFEELGYTDESGVKALKKGYGGAALEALFTLPVVGFVGKSIYVVGRGAKLSLKATVQGGKVVFKASGEAIKAGFKQKSFYKSLGESTASFLKKSSLIQKDLKQIYKGTYRAMGRLSGEYQEVMAKSLLSINPSRAKEMASLLKAGDKAGYLKLLNKDVAQSYLKGLGGLDGLVQTLESYSKQVQKLGHKLESLNNGKTSWRVFRKTRYNRLAKKSPFIDDFSNSLGELKTLLNNNGDFLAWYQKNSSRFDQVVLGLPLRKRHIISVLSQGLPMAKNALPGLGWLRGGVVLKRIARSRDILAYKGYREWAAMIIGLDPVHKGGRALLDWRKAVLLSSSFEDLTFSSNKALREKMNSFERVVTESILQNEKLSKLPTKWLEKSKKMSPGLEKEALEKYAEAFLSKDVESLKGVLFEASNLSEEALSETLLNRVDWQHLLQLKEFDSVASQALRQLDDSIYGKNMSSFEARMAILKMLLIKRKPQVIELF